jgi:hypothetical protein
MAEVYTQRGTFSLKKETVANTAVVPDTFLYFNEEDLTYDYPTADLMRISGSRAKKRGKFELPIPAPKGTIKLNIEPLTFGHFLNGLLGGLTSGRYMAYTALAGGVFAVGNTVTGGSSLKTATVAYVGQGFILVTSPSGAFTPGETISNGGGVSATLTDYDSTVYGHASRFPAEVTTTYSLQINLAESAHRFCGVRIQGIDAVDHTDNIMTAAIKIMAQSHFRCAEVQATVSSGAGAKTITLDQVQGLVATDTIKVYRPSTKAFLDFSATGVKTHTVNSVDSSALTIAVTNLETSLAVGDLIMLAPQTATYSTVKEFAWKGGATVSLGGTIGTVATESVEELSIVVDNDLEERHAASGVGMANRFPTAILQKGIDINGSFKMYYSDERFISYMRDNDSQALRLLCQGAVIASATRYTFKIDIPAVKFGGFKTPLTNDKLIDQEIPFDAVNDSTTAMLGEFLLVNTATSY